MEVMRARARATLQLSWGMRKASTWARARVMMMMRRRMAPATALMIVRRGVGAQRELHYVGQG
jgi:hypothetical protein